MAASAQQNIEWLQTTSAQLAEAAAKATASAAAYEAAFSASIPPPVVYANRAQLAMLVATNILGQNTPAIAANEAMYGEFWAQDATAMSTYAANAAAAAQVTPLTEPTQSTNPGRVGSSGCRRQQRSQQQRGQLREPTGCSAACRAHRVQPPPRHASVGDELTGLYTAIQGFSGVPLISNGFNSFDVTLSWCIMMMASALGTLNHFVGRRSLRCHDRRRPAAWCRSGLRHHTGGFARPASAVARRWPGWAPRPRSAGCRCRPAGRLPLRLPPARRRWQVAVGPRPLTPAVTGTGGAPGIMPGMASAGGKSGMGIGGPRYGVKPQGHADEGARLETAR